ncbi:response regulator [Salinarimonas soli]|uniref:response regulator n=1 Tax=Salinarimonas soli TaxID=1638099 RepID=UPI001F0A9A17|nr:response regulator [Salinarimonas soli]
MAEDNLMVGITLEEDLTNVGYTVAGPFASCSAATAWLKTSTPNIAILDVKLSDGPCIELAHELKKRGVPFIVYSGADSTHRAPEFAQATWIAKPCHHHLILDAVSALRPEPRQRRG